MSASNAKLKISLIGAVLALTAGCSSAPFGYAQDRCLGAHNQCRNNCKDMPFGGAQSACYDRCLARETQCYATGDDGAGSTLSQESLMGLSRSEAEKQAEYERWKAQKERDAADKAAAEAATETTKE